MANMPKPAVPPGTRIVDFLKPFREKMGHCGGGTLTVISATGQIIPISATATGGGREEVRGHCITLPVHENDNPGEKSVVLIFSTEPKEALARVAETGGVIRLHIDHISEWTINVADRGQRADLHCLIAKRIDVVQAAKDLTDAEFEAAGCRWDDELQGVWLPFLDAHGNRAAEHLVCYGANEDGDFVQVSRAERTRRLEFRDAFRFDGAHRNIILH